MKHFLRLRMKEILHKEVIYLTAMKTPMNERIGNTTLPSIIFGKEF